MGDVKYNYIEYKKIFKNQEKRLKMITKLSFIPTRVYLKIVYYIKTGKHLNLKNPIGFSQKINWLKINKCNDNYTKLVDKYEVKNYVSSNYGSSLVIPCLGVWDTFDEIDFSLLPEQFVLKCTHDSGSVRIVKNKGLLDIDALRAFYEGRLQLNHYYLSREYPYKNVKPRIIAEEYLENIENGCANDYKFFCFNGEPKVFYVLSGRMIDEKETWFDINFNRLDIVDITTPDYDENITKPACFDSMLKFVKSIAKGKDFVRVDLYESNGSFYFGELTFFPYGGYVILMPEIWEKTFGDWIDINQ